MRVVISQMNEFTNISLSFYGDDYGYNDVYNGTVNYEGNLFIWATLIGSHFFVYLSYEKDIVVNSPIHHRCVWTI